MVSVAFHFILCCILPPPKRKSTVGSLSHSSSSSSSSSAGFVRTVSSVQEERYLHRGGRAGAVQHNPGGELPRSRGGRRVRDHVAGHAGWIIFMRRGGGQRRRLDAVHHGRRMVFYITEQRGRRGGLMRRHCQFMNKPNLFLHIDLLGW